MNIQRKRVLVTGGSGFIGSHLAAKLAEHNRVTIVDRHPPARRLRGVSFRRFDVATPAFLAFLRRSVFDYFFHLAGNVDLNFAFRNPRVDFERNLFSTFHILDTLRGIQRRPRFIFASSVAVYGGTPDARLREETSLCQPLSNYGVAKLAGERYVYVFARQYGIPAISLRIFPTYGPGLRRQVVYDFIERLSKNPQSLKILGTGREGRDFVFVDDQVKNILRVAARAAYRGEVYNLCSGRFSTTRDIARYVARAIGIRPTFLFTKKIRIFDAKRWVGDTAKIKKLGCTIAVPVREGVARTVDWYRKN